MSERGRSWSNTGKNTYEIAQAFAVNYWLDRERTFIASENRPLDNAETLNIHVNNPVESEKKLYLYYGEMTRGDGMNLTLHTEVENVVSGTPLTVSNNVIGSDVTSDANVTEADSFDSLDTHSGQAYVGSGTEMFFDGYRVIIPPDGDLLVEITSTTGGNEVGVRLGWAEIPLAVGEGLLR